jgi:hypothetical protein
MTMPTDDHMFKPETDAARRVEVFTGAGRRREWSLEKEPRFWRRVTLGRAVFAMSPVVMD